VPAPTLIVEHFEVSASTSSQSQIVISNTIAQWVFMPNQYEILASMMDRPMIQVNTLMSIDFFFVERQHQL
jgi:hypothetical protein